MAIFVDHVPVKCIIHDLRWWVHSGNQVASHLFRMLMFGILLGRLVAIPPVLLILWVRLPRAGSTPWELFVRHVQASSHVYGTTKSPSRSSWVVSPLYLWWFFKPAKPEAYWETLRKTTWDNLSWTRYAEDVATATSKINLNPTIASGDSTRFDVTKPTRFV